MAKSEKLFNWIIRRLDKLSGPNDAGFYNARCPSCANNLSIKRLDDGSVYLQCWGAGYQCSRDNILDALEGQPVLRKKVNPSTTTTSTSSNREWALKLWSEAGSAPGTPVERYLLSRGIVLDPKQPGVLRFHPRLKHMSGVMLPAMIALVMAPNVNGPVGIHRTWLSVTRTTVGKAAVDPNKMALGAIAGGTVVLAHATTKIGLAEGVESALSFIQLTKIPCWAGLGGNLNSVILPPQFTEVVLAVDGDDAGDEYARTLGPRLAREGRKVRIAQAPRGQDWNDLLQGAGNATQRRRSK